MFKSEKVSKDISYKAYCILTLNWARGILFPHNISCCERSISKLFPQNVTSTFFLISNLWSVPNAHRKMERRKKKHLSKSKLARSSMNLLMFTGCLHNYCNNVEKKFGKCLFQIIFIRF